MIHTYEDTSSKSSYYKFRLGTLFRVSIGVAHYE